MHFELLAYSATQPNTGAAASAATGDSLVIKNNIGNIGPRILAGWALNQTTGYHQIAFPTGHDTTRGYRARVPAADVSPLLPIGLGIPLTSQETLSINISGSNTAGDVESGALLIHYPNLPGISMQAITWQQLQSRIQSLTTLEATLTGAASGYTGEELITAESDLLLANRQYAILGATTQTEVTSLYMRGPDFGNVKVGVPGTDVDQELANQFFAVQARAHDLPLIPVINSANKAATYIGFQQNENNVNPAVTWYLALLK